jgi:hypothetical protein
VAAPGSSDLVIVANRLPVDRLTNSDVKGGTFPGPEHTF